MAVILHQPDPRGMNEFAHGFLLWLLMPGPVKKYNQWDETLLVVLN